MVSKRSFCYMTTLDHMLLKQPGKGKRNLGWHVCPHPAYWFSSIRLPLVSIDEAFLTGENLHGSWKYQKRPRFVFLLQSRKLLQKGNSITAIKMGEDHTKWWKLLWWLFFLFEKTTILIVQPYIYLWVNNKNWSHYDLSIPPDSDSESFFW